MTPTRRPNGLTIVELLVAVSVMGVLATLLIPAVQKARDAARRAVCLNNLKQIGLAIHNHAQAHGKFPSGGHGSFYNSLFVQILPFAEQQALYNSINMDRFARSATNTTAASNPPGFYLCPSDARRALAWNVNHAGNLGRLRVGASSNDGDGVFVGTPWRLARSRTASFKGGRSLHSPPRSSGGMLPTVLPVGT